VRAEPWKLGDNDADRIDYARETLRDEGLRQRIELRATEARYSVGVASLR
jgi:hypothetical protein